MWQYICLFISRGPTRWVLAFFTEFLNLSSDAPKYRSFGVGLSLLFEISGLGGGGDHIFEQTAGNLTIHGTEQCTGDC